MTKIQQYEPWLFGAMVVLFIIPLWVYPYIPTQDGPAHLFNAHLINGLLQEQTNPMIDGFYELNKDFTPTWVFHLVLAKLGRMAGVQTAERIILSILIVFLPLVTRFGVSKINQPMAPLAWLVFPMNYNHLFYYGFYSMCFSVPFFVLSFTLVLEFLKSGKKIYLLWIMISGFFSYFMHIISFGLLGIAVALSCIGYAVNSVKGQGKLDAGGFGGFMVSRFVPLFLCYVPVIAVVVLFLGGKQSVFVPELGIGQLAGRMAYLVLGGTLFPIRFTGLFALISVGTLFSVLVVFLVFLLVRPGGFKGMLPKVMLSVFFAFCLVLLFVPQMYFATSHDNMLGGGFIKHRIALFMIPVLILGLASWTNNRDRLMNQLGILIGFSMILFCFHLAVFSHFNRHIKGYLSFGPHIAPDSVILPLNLDGNDGLTAKGPLGVSLFWRTDPLLHASDHLARQTRSISLENYEVTLEYFPLLYRQGMDPLDFGYTDGSFIDEHNGPLEPSAACRNLLTHYEQKGFPVRYILAWGKNGSDKLWKTIHESYALIAKTDRGQLFELKR